MWPNLQFPADLVTFTEEIHNGKPHVLRNVSNILPAIVERKIGEPLNVWPLDWRKN